MKKILAFFVYITCLASQPFHLSAADQAANESWQRLATLERKGVRDFKQGKFKKALPSLSKTARRGYKQAQYFLAFMFLKGYEVKQDIVLGMAWLGVAKESGLKRWNLTFDQIYAVASAEQKKAIDVKIAEYIDMFGAKVQHISCRKIIPAGQRRHQIRCTKFKGVYPIYPFEYELGRWDGVKEQGGNTN